jgi:Leucine-rich repeat (LRR) protein
MHYHLPQHYYIHNSRLITNIIFNYCDNNNITELPVLPDRLQILYCDNNQITSLQYVPPNLKELNCHGNQLTSLQYAPPYLKELYCHNNQLTSLRYAPPNLEILYCGYNKLTSLVGAPKYVGGIFVCNSNPGNFTEEQVRAVCDVKGEVLALPKKLPRLKKI